MLKSCSSADLVFFCCNGELLLGAAGGDGMDVGDGAVIQPMFGLSRDLRESFTILAQLGRVMALSGDLDPTLIEVGLGYRLPRRYSKDRNTSYVA